MNKNIYFVCFIVLVSVLAQLSLLSGEDWLQFSRAEIDAGQWWRFITGNIVHLTWRHWLMNVLGLIAIVMVYPKVIPVRIMFWLVLWCCLVVTFGIWFLHAEILWYVGLSGMLHGLLATLIIVDFGQNKHVFNVLLFLAMVVKLVWEGVMGPIPGSVSMAGGQILVQSHLYGFMGGLFAAVYIILFNKNKKITT